MAEKPEANLPEEEQEHLFLPIASFSSHLLQKESQ